MPTVEPLLRHSIESDPTQPYAALDLGSNSFHLLVAYDRPNRLQVIDRHREQVKLAAGLEQTGELNPLSMSVALSALERIGQRIRNLPKYNVRIVGTNALRTASNRDEFIWAAEKLLGHRIEIISGREEARLVYLGASHSLEDNTEHRLVIDIGGGSTEIILGRHFKPRLMESLRMGCISMSDKWFTDGKISHKRMARAKNTALQEIEVIEQTFRSHKWNLAIGTSGTILAAQSAVSARTPQAITQENLRDLAERLESYGHVDRIESAVVGKERAPLFPGGVAILMALLEALEIDALQVSTGALREGLLHDLLGRVHDQDIREKSVNDLMKRFHIDVEHAERVATMALTLLEQVKHAWDLDGEDSRMLLRWGALLHEIGMDISHASYHKHGGYLIENLDIAGFSVHDQYRLACLVRAHRRTFPVDKLQLDIEINKLILILRLAVVLRRNRSDEPLLNLELRVVDSGLDLRMDKRWLKQHRLTSLDLQQELDFLRNAPYQLSIDSL